MNGKVSEEDWIERIKSAYVSSDHQLAHQLIERALEETDSSPRLLEIAGMMAFERKQYAKATKLIEAAMFEIPLSMSGRMTLAKAWVKCGNYKAAESTLEFLVEFVSRVPCGMLMDLARTLDEINRFDLSLQVCKQSLMRHPEDHKAAFAVGMCLLRNNGELAVAKRYIKRAIGLNPTCWLYRANLAKIDFTLGLEDSAYYQATRIPVAEVKQLPCACLVDDMKAIFLHFEDYERLAQMERE